MVNAVMGLSSDETAICCAGADVELLYPPELNYPMETNKQLFFVDIHAGCIRSNNCPRAIAVTLASPNDATCTNFRCDDCRSLSQDKGLANIIERAKNNQLHLGTTNNCYLTDKQKTAKIQEMCMRNRLLELDRFSYDRRLEVVCKERDDLTRLKVTLSENKIPRVHHILAQTNKENRSTSATVEILRKAIAGTYHAKDFDNDDLDEGIIALRLGGRRAVHALNHSASAGGSSMNTILSRAETPHYTTLSSTIDPEIILKNFKRFVFSEEVEDKCLHHLQIDDIKGEKRVRVDDHDGHVRGICYHVYLNKISLDIRSPKDCEYIRDELNKGTIHYANDITNVAIAPNRETNYNPKIVATSAGCPNGDPIERTKLLVEECIRHYVNNPEGQLKRGILATIQSDSAGQFVSGVCKELFLSQDMDATHPLHSILKDLPFICLRCGKDIFERIAPGSEMKHAAKRFRERLKGPTGCQVTNGLILGGTIRTLFRADKICTEAEMKAMFACGYADAMDVGVTMKFLLNLGKLGELEPSQFGDRQTMFESFQKDSKLLSHIASLMFTYIADKRPSLEVRLEKGSELMHILFCTFRRNGTKFIPAQNYSAWIRMLRSHIWSVATAIVENYDSYFLYQDSGDALEMFYCLLRSLVGGASGSGSGVDLVQVGERISGAMQVDGVYSRRPNLRPKSRHLSTTTEFGSDDHQNPRSFLSTPDKGEDRSRVNVSGLNIQNVFHRGRLQATKKLKEAGFSESEYDWNAIASDPAVDFLRPLGDGKFVGMTDLDEDEFPKDDAANGGDPVNMTDAVSFEEAIGAAPEMLDRVAPPVRKLVVGGQEISAARYLRMVLGKKSATETSRVARNRDAVKSGTEIQEGVGPDDTTDSRIYAGEDPIVALVVTHAGVTVVIISPERFEIDGQKTDSIRRCSFVGDATAEGKIVPANVSGTEISWDTSKRSTENLQIRAHHSVVINPEFRQVDCSGEGDMLRGEYFISIETFQLLLKKLYSEYVSNTGQSAKAASVLPNLKAVSCIPYQCGNKDMFVIDDKSKIASSNARDAKQRDTNVQIHCPVQGCTQKRNVKVMRHHIGWHLEHDVHLLTKNNGLASDALCGMCGSSPAMTYSTNSDGIGCPVWIVRGVPHYQCAKVPYVKFSLKAAAKCTSKAPCTNRPINCTKCLPASRGVAAQAIWSRNMKRHWETVHPGETMSNEIKKLIEVSSKEVEWLKKCALTKPRAKGGGKKSASVTQKAQGRKKGSPSSGMAPSGVVSVSAKESAIININDSESDDSWVDKVDDSVDEADDNVAAKVCGAKASAKGTGVIVHLKLNELGKFPSTQCGMCHHKSLRTENRCRFPFPDGNFSYDKGGETQQICGVAFCVLCFEGWSKRNPSDCRTRCGNHLPNES